MIIALLILIPCLLIVSGMMKGIADEIQRDPDYRENGWKTKWSLNDNGTVKVMDGEMVERFPGSSTVFVWLTDKWHLANFINHRIQDMITTLLLVEVSNDSRCFLSVVLLPVFRWIGFKITYRND